MAIPEPHCRRREPVILGEDIGEPVEQAQMVGAVVERHIEFLGGVFPFLPPGVDRRDRSVGRERTQGRGRVEVETLGTQQQGTHQERRVQPA